MRTAEISLKYNIHKNTVKKWIQKGLLKAKLVKPEWGGHDYYDVTQEDFDIYLANCDRKTTDN